MATTATPRRFDGWARHPAPFSFDQLDAAVDAAQAPDGGLVVDPFAGTGVTVTFVCGRGDPVVGIEAHPLIADLARVKLARPGAPAELRAVVAEVRPEATGRLGAVDLAREAASLQRFLPAERHAELVAWREVVERVGGPWEGHLRWLVLGALRDVAGKGWPYPRADRRSRHAATPIGDLVEARARRMADDLMAGPRLPLGTVVSADSRRERAWVGIAPGSVAASISSPPYLNQVSYAEATRLELLFVGLTSSWGEMSERVSRHLVASCTQQVTVASGRAARESLADCAALTATLAPLSRRLLAARRRRSKGKIYDHLLWAYFADMRLVLAHLHRALAPGGRAAWVIGDSAPYGVYVDTPALTGVLAQELGFELVEDRVLRARGGRWPNVGARHGRQLSERLVVLRRPPLGFQEALPGV